MNYLLLFILAIISFIDIKTKHIPDLIVITGMLAGFIYNHFALNFMLGILVGCLSVHLLNTFHIQYLGGGDCKLLGMLGAFLGWQAVLIIYGISMLLIIPYKVFRIAKERRGAFAYSPFITMASLILFILC